MENGTQACLEVNYVDLKSVRVIRRDAPGREPSRILCSGSSECVHTLLKCARALHYAQLESSVCLALWFYMLVPNNSH